VISMQKSLRFLELTAKILVGLIIFASLNDFIINPSNGDLRLFPYVPQFATILIALTFGLLWIRS
jgi:hypothetical protein